MSDNNPQATQNAANSQQIQIKATDEKWTGSYATAVNISYTPEEFVFDFFSLFPNSPMGQLIERVIVSPNHAKRFSAILQDLIKKYDNKELVSPQQAPASTVDNKIGFDLNKEQ